MNSLRTPSTVSARTTSLACSTGLLPVPAPRSPFVYFLPTVICNTLAFIFLGLRRRVGPRQPDLRQIGLARADAYVALHANQQPAAAGGAGS